MKDWYLIGDFSKKTGLSVKALRHYQEVDLLSPCARGENQYRYYSEAQVTVACQIREYKKLGFTLEDIKQLCAASQEKSLRALLEKRLKSIDEDQQALTQQKSIINSILTSLNADLELSNTQRSFIMENLLEKGIEGLKRRGVAPTKEVISKPDNEIQNLSPKQEALIKAIQEITEQAKGLNVMLGPGRGSSPASLLLYGAGLTPMNPLKFNLIPELYSGANSLWLDVEFSRSKEIGNLCRKLSKDLDYPIVAFKCPFLDILQRVQDQVGLIDFDLYEDNSEVVISAFKQSNLRGIWNFDWSPNFTAFQRMNEQDQKRFFRDQSHFETWFQNYEVSGVEDILNTGFLHDMRGEQDLELYKSLKASKVHYPFLKESSRQILYPSHGLLLWREDWLRLLCDNSQLTITEAIKIFKAVANEAQNTPEYQLFMELQSKDLRDLLQEKSKTVFLKSQIASGFWYIKRSAILKSLWTDLYLKTLDNWEQEKGLIWQEFGYEDHGERFFEA